MAVPKFPSTDLISSKISVATQKKNLMNEIKMYCLDCHNFLDYSSVI